MTSPFPKTRVIEALSKQLVETTTFLPWIAENLPGLQKVQCSESANSVCV